jgi:hypothetical protein
MLTTYTKQDDIPEALREHYKLIEGKWTPEVSDDHPIKVTNANLKTEKSEVEAKLVNTQADLTTTKADLEAARTKGLPHGHIAIPKADAELVGAVKAAGITTPDAFTALQTEHGRFKQEAETATREKTLRDLGRVMGWDVDKTALLLSTFTDLPEIEFRDTTEKEADGTFKKNVIAKVKGADSVVTEKPFADYVAGTERLNALVPALTVGKQPDGTPFPTQGAGGGSAKINPADSYLASVDSAPKARQATA